MATGSDAHAPIMPLGSFSILKKRISLTSVLIGSFEELISSVPAIWKSSPKRLLLFPLPLHRKNIRGDQIGAIGTDSPVWPRVRQPGMKIGIEYGFCRELESPAIHRG